MSKLDLPKVNFDVREIWEMTCPYCEEEQEAPFNKGSPMQPMEVECMRCGEPFILTYDRD